MISLFPHRTRPLLGATDLPPAVLIEGAADSPVAIVCEHAGQAVPARLNGLGLAKGDIDKHVGWDIGAREVSRLMAERLAAPAALQNYSRLVIDCNRPPRAADSTPAVSHGIAVPGNAGLSNYDHWLRIDEIFVPFQNLVDSVLDASSRRIAVSIHSFEPVLAGRLRPWDIGLLHRHDTKTSQLLLRALRKRRPEINAALNEPYTIDDESDFFVPYHGEGRGIAHVLVEIRNDHIRSPEGCAEWAMLLSDCINDILPEL